MAAGALILLLINTVCVQLSGSLTFICQGFRGRTYLEREEAKSGLTIFMSLDYYNKHISCKCPICKLICFMDIQWIQEMLKGNFIEELGIEFLEKDSGVILKLNASKKLMAPNGYIHGGAITSLADTACGIGAFLTLEKDQNFTTIELKTNFISAAKDGDDILCESKIIHKGRTTKFGMEVFNPDSKKKIALTRCTIRFQQINSFIYFYFF